MGIFLQWLGVNWFDLLQTTGIVAGLFFTGRSLLLDSRIRKISNLLSVTEHHRSIWQQVFDRPSLLRVLSKDVNLRKHPTTVEERIFVNLIILHFTAVNAAIQGKIHKKPAGQDADLREFFSLPIPRKVWEDSKRFREPEVVTYVESLLANKAKKKKAGLPRLSAWLRLRWT